MHGPAGRAAGLTTSASDTTEARTAGRERRSARQRARPSPPSQRRGARGTRRTAPMPGLSHARRAVGRAAARPPRSATAGPCTSTRVTCCCSVCDARRRSDHWTGGAWCWGREGRAPGTQRPRRKGRVSSSPGRLPRDSEAQGCSDRTRTRATLLLAMGPVPGGKQGREGAGRAPGPLGLLRSELPASGTTTRENCHGLTERWTFKSLHI